jgi:hypothetical protein
MKNAFDVVSRFRRDYFAQSEKSGSKEKVCIQNLGRSIANLQIRLDHSIIGVLGVVE